MKSSSQSAVNRHWNRRDAEICKTFAKFAIIADFAILPLKWLAEVREQGAELTFCVGGYEGAWR
jgi:hypothetical protein